ncbi:MAG: hypothetical protein SFV51_06355 [Bryobacteraceae bacterium]|nr:hypothetical protein [Bryobacteraceae bacterium]
MRCLYCGEKLAKPADADNAFCTTAHRMLYQWHSTPANGNGTSHTAPSIIELVSKAEQGETLLAGSRPLSFPPMKWPITARHGLAEPLSFPRTVSIIAAAIPLAPSMLLFGGDVWTLLPEAGRRKPRPLRGPGFVHFSVTRALPSPPADPFAAMPLGRPADLARSTSKNRPYLQPKTDKPLPISTARARAVMTSLRNRLSVTDIEPPKPVVADLRRKVAAASSTASGEVANPFQRLDYPEPVAPLAAKVSRPLAAIPPAVQVSGLDTLGSQCVERHLASVRLGGSDAWTPGPVPYEPFESPAAWSGGQADARAVPAYPAEDLASRPSIAPLLRTAFFQNEDYFSGILPQATELPLEWVAPPVECRDLAACPVVSCPPEEMEPAAVRVPSSAAVRPGLLLSEPGLVASPRLEAIAAPGAGPSSELEFAPSGDSAIQTVLPGHIISRPLGTGLTLEQGCGLFPMTPFASSPRAPVCLANDCSFVPSPLAAPHPAGLSTGLSKWLAPPLVRTLARYAPQAVIHFSGQGFMRSELAPMNSDPIRIAPRLSVRLSQDEGVAEAVRQFKAANGTGFLRTIQDTLPNLKSLRMASASSHSILQGRMKWALAAVPVMVVAGYMTLQSPDPAATTVANAPAAVEPARETAPVVEITPPASTVQANAPSPATAPAPEEAIAAPPETKTGFLATVRAAILKRAAISLADDFRSGLGDWQGSGQWSRQWSYDAAGFLNTGPSVVLYTPSLKLTDYRVDFLGQIERRSLGWVIRAKDHRNYHAGKITLTKSGPLPRAIVEHYVVVNGRPDRHQSRPLPLEIRSDTLYRVRMDVEGEDFTLSVQGQIVDHWSDNRHPSGGVGFFSDRGEQSRLRWVEVTHQADTIGKLCAFLAPYSLPAREGNQKQ